MFPGCVKDFMRIYHQATSQPYGHLVVDTNEILSNRLKTNIFASRTFQDSTKEENIADSLQNNSLDLPRDQESKERADNNVPPINSCANYNLSQTFDNMSNSKNMAHSCDDCGTLFDTSHDLQQHVKTWCPEREPPTKVRRTDGVAPCEAILDTAQTKPMRSSESELGIFRAMLKRVERGNRSERKYKIEKYMEQGFDQSETEEKADEKLWSSNFAKLIKAYTSLIMEMMELGNGIIHNEVMDAITTYKDKGFSEKEAVFMAVKSFESNIESLLLSHEDSDQSGDSVDNTDSDDGEDNSGSAADGDTDVDDNDDVDGEGDDDDSEEIDDDEEEGDSLKEMKKSKQTELMREAREKERKEREERERDAQDILRFSQRGYQFRY